MDTVPAEVEALAVVDVLGRVARGLASPLPFNKNQPPPPSRSSTRTTTVSHVERRPRDLRSSSRGFPIASSSSAGGPCRGGIGRGAVDGVPAVPAAAPVAAPKSRLAPSETAI